MDESTLLPREFHSKLYLLIEQPNKIELECNSISKAIRMQSNEFQQLWDNYTKAFLSNLTETSQETILSEENDTLQCSDNTDQFQEEVIDKKLLEDFKNELKIYQQEKIKLETREASIPSLAYSDVCWFFKMDATKDRLMQVDKILQGLNEQMTNYQFFGLLTKYMRMIEESYKLSNRYKGRGLHGLLERYCEKYEEMMRKNQVAQALCMN